MTQKGITRAGSPILAAIVALLALSRTTDCASLQATKEEGTPSSFIDLVWDTACDAKNRRLYLDNKHSFKTVAVTVRWRADGGRVITQEFFADQTPSRKWDAQSLRKFSTPNSAISATRGDRV